MARLTQPFLLLVQITEFLCISLCMGWAFGRTASILRFCLLCMDIYDPRALSVRIRICSMFIVKVVLSLIVVQCAVGCSARLYFTGVAAP